MTHYDIYGTVHAEDSPNVVIDGEEKDKNNVERKYVMMTSVSMPVFGKDVNATLLGVAGIDVPLFEFQRLLKPDLVRFPWFLLNRKTNFQCHF